MSEIKYFYADPFGTVRENPEVWPLAVLAENFPEGTVFRFAFDQSTDSFFIQDASFRDRMRSGDKDAWHFVNESIRFLKTKYDAGFLNKAYGDPADSSVRRLMSQYTPAWQYLNEYLQDEAGESPVNMAVCEFVPGKNNPTDTVSLILPGTRCGNMVVNEPTIALNRYLHKDESLGGAQDVDWALLNEALAAYYLRNMESIYELSASPEDSMRLLSNINKYSDGFGFDLMVAYPENGSIKIIKTHDKALTESDVRASTGTEFALLFSYIPDQERVVFHNYMPSEMSKHEGLSNAMDSVLKLVSRSANINRADVILSFEPSLHAPFVSKLSRYHIPWIIGQDRFGEKLRDVKVAEVPLNIPGGAIFIRNSSEEPEELKDLRVRFGMAVKYPFIAVDNRSCNLGLKYRAILNSLAAEKAESSDGRWIDKDYGIINSIRDTKNILKTKRHMEFMLRMGMPRKHIIDFYADRQELTKRAEYRKILKQAWQDASTTKNASVSNKKCKISAIGPSYDVNSWWYIGLQDELNQAQHSKTETEKPLEPFNLRKFKKEDHARKDSYEALLNPKRDKNLGYFKSVEQLLSENRI